MLNVVGKRVAAIRRMTEQETASRGWNCSILPTVLVLDDGSIVMASGSDSAGSAPGMIHVLEPRDLSATPDSDETQKWEGSETQTECSLVPSVSTSKADSGDSGADSDASEDLFHSGPQQAYEGGLHDPNMRMLQEDASGTERPDEDTEEPGLIQLAVEKTDDVQTESSSTEDEAPEQDTEQEQEQENEKEGATEGARPSKSLPTDRLLSNATAAASPTCRLSGTDPYAFSGGDSKSEGMGGDRSSHHQQREDATLTLPTHTQELVASPSNAANEVEEVEATQRWEDTEGDTQEYEELAASSSNAANEVEEAGATQRWEDTELERATVDPGADAVAHDPAHVDSSAGVGLEEQSLQQENQNRGAQHGLRPVHEAVPSKRRRTLPLSAVVDEGPTAGAESTADRSNEPQSATGTNERALTSAPASVTSEGSSEGDDQGVDVLIVNDVADAGSINVLKEMFPQLERAVCEIILESNGGNVEAAAQVCAHCQTTA
jgi:hypothetical protein